MTWYILFEALDWKRNLFVCMSLTLLEEQIICVHDLNFGIRSFYLFTYCMLWYALYVFSA